MTKSKRPKLLRFEKDLRAFTTKELRDHFASKKTGRIKLTPLIRNVIWQAYQRIQSGEEEPVRGNLKTFWYRFVKPVVAKVPRADEYSVSPYERTSNIFANMVILYQLFSYRDFDFTDENWENRRIGTKRSDVLVFAEKNGWVRFLRQVHERWGVSTLSLGGFPSVLTSEYTAHHLKEVTNPENTLKLIGLVDYDPSGDLIAHAFQGHMNSFGFPNTSLATLIEPSLYTQEEIELFKFPLPKKRPTIVSNWMEKTGGLGGEMFGLESESMSWDQLFELLSFHLDRGD